MDLNIYFFSLEIRSDDSSGVDFISWNINSLSLNSLFHDSLSGDWFVFNILSRLVDELNIDLFFLEDWLDVWLVDDLSGRDLDNFSRFGVFILGWFNDSLVGHLSGLAWKELNNLFSFFDERFDDWLGVNFVGGDLYSLNALRFSISGLEGLGWVDLSLRCTLNEFGVYWVSFSDNSWFRYDSFSDWFNYSLGDDSWFGGHSLFDDFWLEGLSSGVELSLSDEVLGWNSVKHKTSSSYDWLCLC